MSKQEEIIEVAGKKVVVRYARTQEDACVSCAFRERKECHDLDCNLRDIIGEGVCRYAYFVPAEEIEGTHKEVTLIPSNEDEDEAAEKYGKEHTILPDEYNDGDIPLYEGWTAEAFKAGIAYERERLMKEAHDGMIERDCGGQVMLDVPDIWEHGEYTLLNQHKYPDMKPGERRRVKVLIVENE